MQASSNIKRYHYFIFSAWLVFTVIVGASFIKSRLNEFDPNEQLLNLDSEKLIKEIRLLPQLKTLDFENVLIHFTSESCNCTKYSKNHKKDITTRAIADGFRVINVQLPATTKTIIPSTPSILIAASPKDLLYFGPYSAGLACSASNGFVELALNNYTNGFVSDLIINDVTGCYCHI